MRWHFSLFTYSEVLPENFQNIYIYIAFVEPLKCLYYVLKTVYFHPIFKLWQPLSGALADKRADNNFKHVFLETSFF